MSERAGMEADVAIIGGGPGGMQAAIHLALEGVDVLLIEPRLGAPEAPGGVVTIPRRSKIFGEGFCGHPHVVDDWSLEAECVLDRMMLAGRHVIGEWDAKEVLGYNFTRKKFWNLMLDGARRAGARVLDARVTRARKNDSGIMLETTAGPVDAKAVIYAAGVRGDPDLPRQLEIGTPTTVHGIFTDFKWDGAWNSPPLCILFNLDLVPSGYFWCARAEKSGRVSIGILNEGGKVDPKLLYRFARTGIIPEIKALEDGLEIEEGQLGAISHVKTNHWPIQITSPRVISIGEASGMIASYIYEGIFAARYEGMIAARVMARVAKEEAFGNFKKIKEYESTVKRIDNWVLHLTRQQHHAMYHGGNNGLIALEGYLKGFNENHKIIVGAMREQYVNFSNFSRYEFGLFKAILSHVPLFSKLAVTASLVSARMQK
ncbi:MAG: NAD(P)/FAD-dependent oxidoreductase [Promethearchaeota archaeon]